MQRKLRMADGGRRGECAIRLVTDATDQLPRLLVEVGVESRRTTAPCGSFAMTCSSFAVDGIEPVEPAAITGPA